MCAVVGRAQFSKLSLFRSSLSMDTKIEISVDTRRYLVLISTGNMLFRIQDINSRRYTPPEFHSDCFWRITFWKLRDVWRIRDYWFHEVLQDYLFLNYIYAMIFLNLKFNFLNGKHITLFNTFEITHASHLNVTHCWALCSPSFTEFTLNIP